MLFWPPVNNLLSGSVSSAQANTENKKEESSSFCFSLTLMGLVLISVTFQRKTEKAKSTFTLLKKNKASSGPRLQPEGILFSTANKNCARLFPFESSDKSREPKGES